MENFRSPPEKKISQATSPTLEPTDRAKALLVAQVVLELPPSSLFVVHSCLSSIVQSVSQQKVLGDRPRTFLRGRTRRMMSNPRWTALDFANS